MSQAVSQWLGKIENDLPNAVERLKAVQIENMDYKELLRKYDGEDTLFHLDPPLTHVQVCRISSTVEQLPCKQQVDGFESCIRLH